MKKRNGKIVEEKKGRKESEQRVRDTCYRREVKKKS